MVAVEISSRTYFEGERRNDACAVAAVNAGLLDVFHDCADHGGLAIGDAIDIHFDRVFEETIDQHGTIRRDFDRALHVTPEIFFIVNELHRAAAEDEDRPNQHRIADFLAIAIASSGCRRTRSGFGAGQVCRASRRKAPVFGRLDAFRLRADNRNACGLQSVRQIQRRLSAKLDNHAFWFFLVINVEHVFERERLKVEFVARVVIGGDRFRIRVDHDRFESELAQREGGVHTAVIEFDSLADAVRSATEDHDLALPLSRRSFSSP